MKSEQRSLFEIPCQACPRRPFCAQSAGKLCLLPTRPDELERYTRLTEQRIASLRGIGPRALPAVVTRPVLPHIMHIHKSNGKDQQHQWQYHMGLGREVIKHRQQGCQLKYSYLADRNFLRAAKFLVISGRDYWLQKFLESLGEEFFADLRGYGFSAVVGPNLSAYHHTEHRVWLDNRALAQNFMEELLRRRLPGIFFTYLEDAPVHQQWLIRYLQENPSQEFIATGFDRGKGNDHAFVRRRLDMLAEIEDTIKRPLKIVLCNLMTRLPMVRAASTLFPGRIHLAANSVFLRSLKGSLLIRTGKGIGWREQAPECEPGLDLFERNAQSFEEVLRSEIPTFFRSPSALPLRRPPRPANQPLSFQRTG